MCLTGKQLAEAVAQPGQGVCLCWIWVGLGGWVERVGCRAGGGEGHKTWCSQLFCCS